MAVFPHSTVAPEILRYPDQVLIALCNSYHVAKAEYGRLWRAEDDDEKLRWAKKRRVKNSTPRTSGHW